MALQEILFSSKLARLDQIFRSQPQQALNIAPTGLLRGIFSDKKRKIILTVHGRTEYPFSPKLSDFYFHTICEDSVVSLELYLHGTTDDRADCAKIKIPPGSTHLQHFIC